MTKTLVFCMKCGKCLGDYKPLWGKQHMTDFPTHREFFVKPIVDPLLLNNPDEWFRRKGICPERVRKDFVSCVTKSERIQIILQRLANSILRFFTERKPDTDFTEPWMISLIRKKDHN